MDFNQDTQQKIEQFAKEQSQRYLDAAEMTYMEKIRSKTDSAKRKIDAKMARFRVSSEQAEDARDDLILYMSDYMGDLMSSGLSEQEAFEKAKAELSASSESGNSADLHDRYRSYYEGMDPSGYEAVGLFYAGFSTLGLVLGAFIGFLVSGGRTEFLGGGWIDTLIGAVVGVLLGVAFAQIVHAVLARKGK